MPGGDRTGPLGLGSRTGRAAGYCMGGGMPGYFNPSPGRGRGAGWGRGFGASGGGGWGRGGGGRGWRHMFHATGLPGWLRSGAGPSGEIDPGTEKEVLSRRVEALQSELEAIQKRLGELDNATTGQRLGKGDGR
ncbi:MAG: DUF5320 domain-containing protein [Ignavibacteriaceae bacterium]|nr:DUF5320 domain-containing protein [Ignavibacteriaceae bacterium]